MSEFVHDDGSVRQRYYGEGEQPFDTILKLHWAPHFCAGNIIKYLRREKDTERDDLKASWYWAQLCKLAHGGPHHSEAGRTMTALMYELTEDEFDKLEPK